MNTPLAVIESRRNISRKDRMRHIRWASSAASVWKSLGGKQPHKVEMLKERSVFRLMGVGFKNTNVIAKRLQRDMDGKLTIELTVYEKVLPLLPIPTLHYYGCVKEQNDKCWIFVEDADGEEYSTSLRQHRILAAEWLGIFHTSAPRISQTLGVPDYGPSYYQSTMHAARKVMLINSNSPDLDAGSKSIFRNIVSLFDHLQTRWEKVERFCAGIPRTLIHGDFTHANLSVRIAKPKSVIICFDWEKVGIGVPGIDLQSLTSSAKPDLATYRKTVRSCWNLDMETVRQLEQLGNLFRCINVINWDCEYLGEDWTLAHLKEYSALLTKTLGRMDMQYHS